MTSNTFAAVLALVAGVGIISLWTVLLIKRGVPEIRARDRAIWFHLAAEYLLGLSLMVGGLALLLSGDSTWARVAAATAFGGMVYSTINSPGYYARERNWAAVVAFLALTGLGIMAIVMLALS